VEGLEGAGVAGVVGVAGLDSLFGVEAEPRFAPVVEEPPDVVVLELVAGLPATLAALGSGLNGSRAWPAR
jgi:hypothetical protein